MLLLKNYRYDNENYRSDNESYRSDNDNFRYDNKSSATLQEFLIWDQYNATLKSHLTRRLRKITTQTILLLIPSTTMCFIDICKCFYHCEILYQTLLKVSVRFIALKKRNLNTFRKQLFFI